MQTPCPGLTSPDMFSPNMEAKYHFRSFFSVDHRSAWRWATNMHRRFFIAVLVALLFLAANAHAASEQETLVISLWSHAKIFLDEGKADRAKTIYQAILFIDPYNFEARAALENQKPFSKPFNREVTRLRPVDGLKQDRAMELQLMRFNAVSTGRLLPATNPQLGLEKR